MNKDGVSAPIVATEALMLTCVIDAMEHRDVATVDIPGAFIQADMGGEYINIKLEGKMVYLLAKLNPKKETPEQIKKQIEDIEKDLILISRFTSVEFSELVSKCEPVFRTHVCNDNLKGADKTPLEWPVTKAVLDMDGVKELLNV